MRMCINHNTWRVSHPLYCLRLLKTFGGLLKTGEAQNVIPTAREIWQQQQQPFNGLFSRTTWVSQYQKGKTNLDFTGARNSEWQWHQLGHVQVCTSLQTDNHASTPPLYFLQARCPSCRPTNSIKALKARQRDTTWPEITVKASVTNVYQLHQQGR